MIPKRIKVIKEFTFDKWLPYFVCKIKVDEIGKYFEHSDVYNFEARNGYVPYIDRKLALNRPMWIEKLED